MIIVLVLIYYIFFGSSLNMIAFTKILKKFDKVKKLYYNLTSYDESMINKKKYLSKKKIIVLNDGL